VRGVGLIAVNLVLLSLTRLCLAQSCANPAPPISVASLKASAGIYANLRNRPGSVKYESRAVFLKGKERWRSVQKSPPKCPTGCKGVPSLELVFRSAPLKTPSSGSDRKYCLQRLAATRKTPLRFRPASFSTVDDLSTWMSDFSQGKGKEGAALYAQCDRKCSPRYEYQMTSNPDQSVFDLTALVTCGLPRDSWDGMYSLEAFFQWRCDRA
jgi:hypothetical protein